MTVSYECNVRVDGHKITGLIDIGGACTLIRTSVVDRFDLTVITIEEGILRRLAGYVITTKESVNVQIQVKEAMASVDALVVPDACIAYESIIGRDYINQDHIIMIKHRGELLVKQVAPEKTDGNDEMNINVCDILTGDDMCIGNIDDSAQQKCKELLEEFSGCVSSSLQNLGKTGAAAMEIRCITETPIVYRP